ncbi:hypothetical protein [Endozoicomonas ascidiicola]|uniref:hypothetical protein n=1 Tax=Endozoicomonas ascidiicola TaxID=1698521 RepID=UPI00082E1137|nr:hypothetical protein [Endozoicomonas ascidiicola]
MTITYKAFSGDCVGARCLSASLIPGKELGRGAADANGRLVTISCKESTSLIVDTCMGGDVVKEIDASCRFIIPENDLGRSKISGYIKSLAERKIFALKEIELPNIELIKRECRESFYHPNGELKNPVFNNEGITPFDMSELGMKFVGGNKENDRTVCALNERHGLVGWSAGDNPRNDHIRCFGDTLPCIKTAFDRYPVIKSKAGHDITKRHYTLVTPENKVAKRDFYCDKSAMVVENSLSPLQFILEKEIGAVIKEIDADKLDQQMKELRNKNEYGKEYKELLSKKYRASYFDELLETYKTAKDNFLRLSGFVLKKSEHDAELNSDEESIRDAKWAIEILNSNNMEEEVNRRLSSLIDLLIVSHFVQYGLPASLPHNVINAGGEAMLNQAREDFVNSLPAASGAQCFNREFNELVMAGEIRCLFKRGYGTVAEMSDSNPVDQLCKSGNEVLTVFANLSHLVEKLSEAELGAFETEI